MYALLSHAIVRFFSPKENNAHGAYLASSTDIADLERRMHRIDEETHDYSMRFCGSMPRSRDVSVSNF